MLSLLLLHVALAAPAGWTAGKTGAGCQLYIGPGTSGSIPPVRAECRWPEVDPQRVIDLLSDWGAHDDYHQSIVSADVLRTEGGRSLVLQVHQATGISDRQVTVWGSQTPVEGGARLAWTMTGAEQSALGEGRVAVARDDGSWTITADPAGGTSAIYELAYEPGGSVPGFVVRWFQSSGVIAIAGEVRAQAGG